MRVWDIPAGQLCNKHLVAQHHEIHCIHSIIVNQKKGYARHPEVMRWREYPLALTLAHNLAAKQMLDRGYRHHSPLYHVGNRVFKEPNLWQPISEQKTLLKQKGCGCKV